MNILFMLVMVVAGSSVLLSAGAEESEKLKFDLGYIGNSNLFSLGQLIESNSIVAEWNSGNDLFIINVQVAESPIMLKLQNAPYIMRGSGGFDSTVRIPHTIQIPSELCEDVIDLNCVHTKLYEIPVTITAEHDGIEYTSTTLVLVDLRPLEPTDMRMLNLILLVTIGIGVIVVVLVRRKRKKDADKPKGQTKNGFQISKLSDSAKKYNFGKLETTAGRQLTTDRKVQRDLRICIAVITIASISIVGFLLI